MKKTLACRLGIVAGLSIMLAGGATARAEALADDPLAPWRQNVTIRDVSARPHQHTIHAYYLCNPESPDGDKVLLYASTASNSHHGELCVVDRATGQETTIVRGVNTEDAHRAACQQWSSNGERVTFHDVQEGRWNVSTVDLKTLERRVLMQNRQVGFGNPRGDLVPAYGCHWNPGEHRHLELVNVISGESRVELSIAAVEKAYGDYLQRQFAGKPTSIFFPVTSPDQKRIFFKMAAGAGGDVYQSKAASARHGLMVYDLEKKRLLAMHERWGHPAWFPDSRRIINMGNLIHDSDDNLAMERIADLPSLRGCHPSVSPDGRLFVQDGLLGELGDEPNQWGVVVGDVRGGQGRYQVVHKFQNNRGARSWRVAHPHPVFSADGRRIYFNVSEGEWTRLMVAEAPSLESLIGK